MDVAEWQRGVGLEKYMPAFRANDIDGEVLRRLTGEDLRELVVNSIGRRRRPLDGIAALSTAEAPPAPTPVPIAASGLGSIHISMLRMPAAMARSRNLRSTDQKRGPQPLRRSEVREAVSRNGRAAPRNANVLRRFCLE